MNRTSGGKWVVTNTYADFGKHRLFAFVVGGEYRWQVMAWSNSAVCAFGSASTLHAARVAAKRASARLQGLGYSGVKAK